MYLNRIRDSFDTPTRVMVVQSLALSMINSCSIIWGATTKEQMESPETSKVCSKGRGRRLTQIPLKQLN